MAIDPICGMTVDSKSAAGKQKHGEETYYFCSRRCMVKFIGDPETFLKEPRRHHAHNHAALASPVDRAAETDQAPKSDEGAGAYVCPMDPEVRESRPAACPRC